MKPNKMYLFTLIMISTFAVIVFGLVSLYFVKLDVLDDSSWKMTADKTSYQVGEQIILSNEVIKKRSVTGEQDRYIICKTPTNSEARFAIGEAPGNAMAGNNKRDVYLKIPDLIPNIPTTCMVEFNINYGMFYKREIKRSPEFQVTPKQETVIEGQPTTQLTPENDNSVLENTPATRGETRTITLPNKFDPQEPPSPQTAQNAPQEEAPPTQEQTQPQQRGFLQRTVDGIITTVRNLL